MVCESLSEESGRADDICMFYRVMKTLRVSAAYSEITRLPVMLLLLSVCECDSVEVKGHTGQDITLPCKYDRKYYGALSVCWQRGEIPTRGCSNQLISTDGLTVETRASSRYQLLGRLEDGDVSLTIKSLTEGDAGRYGCRVEIPGWFNDDKHHIDVSVVTAPHILTTITTVVGQTGSDVTATDSMPTQTQTEVRITAVQQVDHLENFIWNSVRLTFIIVIPALLMTAAHRVWRRDQRLQTDSRLNQSDEEEGSPL
ncbi:hepatitis A virus cellular receptor 1 homolog [Oreochromis aureus]|uniref:hepatitis A virus cellular receptor 1 homolog n=1 Tax=Oreochromis aureus TaxID=47969 RepID=UPI001952D459|nr:hepatitis A virus cellular receptor 1 homolog [Oreochromis aureus]